MEKKVWIISGEASGDLYGAGLANSLHRIAAEKGDKLNIAGMGGPRMQKENIDILVDSSELGVMGLIEVLKQIFTFVRVFFKLLKLAKKERPDAVILIDYPGFNLMLAKALYRNKINVVWYVSPHLWVWGKKRLPVLAKICRKVLVIFPFEVDIFAQTPLKADFVGHPLIEIVEQRTDSAIKRDPDTFLLLPGSRNMEVDKLLPAMLETITELSAKQPNLIFHLAAPREKVRNRCQKIYDKFKRQNPQVPKLSISSGETGYWLQKSATGIAASGTVTVESAIAGLPLVVVYRLNPITFAIARRVVKLYRGYFTMANIIANKTVYREFIQFQLTKENLLSAVEEILPGGIRRAEVEAGVAEVKSLLQSSGKSASLRAAEEVYKVLDDKEFVSS